MEEEATVAEMEVAATVEVTVVEAMMAVVEVVTVAARATVRVEAREGETVGAAMVEMMEVAR